MKSYVTKGLYIVDIPQDYLIHIEALNGITQDVYQKNRLPISQINGSLYKGSYKNPIGTVIYNGEIVNDAGNGFGVGEINGTIGWGSPWEKKWDNYISGYPGLIKDGKALEWSFYDKNVFDNSTRRSGIAQKKDRVYFIASQSGMTLKQFRNTLLDMQMDYAINLDGGGSSRLYYEGKVINKPTDNRKIANIIGAWANSDIKEPTNNIFTVCIDPGHGIETAGKRSPDGSYLEYEFNLDVAKRLKRILEKHSVNVILTKENEHDISLQERVNIANKSNVDYFISIHSNASGDTWSNAQGLEVYVISKGGKAEQLADEIRKYAIPLINTLDRGTKVQNLYVIRETKMPAVLVEHGFHTNQNELKKLKSDEYREKYAIGDAKGILSILNIPYKGDNSDEPTNPIEEENEVKIGISIKKQNVYDKDGNKEKNRYIDKNDKCEVGPILNNMLIQVKYPTTAGERIAYVKSLEYFSKN